MSSTDKSSKITKFKIKFKNFSYPLTPNSYWLFFGVFLPFYFPIQPGEVYIRVLGKVGLFSFLVWIRLCVISRILLTVLLKHKGFILETRGEEPSKKTQIYKWIIETVQKWNKPLFLGLENALPRMAVPPLDETIPKYLESIRPLTDDENFLRISKEAETFQKDLGKKLQRKLVFKSWKAESYVSDWWEEFHYLKSREPLMYGTSIYISDNINCPTKSQSARAANLVSVMLQYREKIRTQQLEPIYVREIIPISVSAYQKLFNTTRVPGINGDKIANVEESKHIAVLHKGCYYKVDVLHNDRLLNAVELQHQLKEILESQQTTSSIEQNIASLTGWNRTKWAEVRDKYFATGINKNSLDVIETAAFVLSLDDEPYNYNLDSSPKEYGQYGKQLLVGNGHNRWFDKSFNLCVGSNGKAGVLGEHTWGDGNIVSHFFEECIINDYHCYDEHGNLKGQIEYKPKNVSKLNWELDDDELKCLISEAGKAAEELVTNVDHRVAVHKKFGRGFMKSCKVSPDAFIQMAFQLAYFRQHKKFCLTYEPAMTRLFRKGRTETIRSCTKESSAWSKSMDDKNFNKRERLELFKTACQKHQKLYLDAMYGKGVDRHLFALQVSAQQNKADSNFLNEAVNEPFMMLTSHIPHSQTPKTDHSKNEFLISAGGAMPPGSHKGYGISYFPFNDELLFLHVTSMKNCEKTDTEALLNGIIKALSDIKNLFEN
ncbi:hypothetical protein ACKWTF_006398 [Chironomus riparius]